MKPTQIFSAIGLTAVIAFPSVASALTSNSYTLYDEFPNFADRQAGESASYVLNEAGETWYNAPLTGPSYSIVSGFASSESSSSDATSSSASSEIGGTSGGGGGGHRGSDDIPTRPESGMPDANETDHSSDEALENADDIFDDLHFAPVTSPWLGTLPEAARASRVMGERTTDIPHFFMTTDKPELRHASAPIVIEQPLIVTWSKSYTMTLVALQTIIFMVLGMLYFALKQSSMVFTGVHGGYAGIMRFFCFWILDSKKSDNRRTKTVRRKRGVSASKRNHSSSLKR